MRIISEQREAKTTLELMADLKEKYGTWKKVAEKLGINDRSLRRYRDGTRTPAKQVAAKTAQKAKSAKIRKTKTVPVQSGAGDKRKIRKALKKAKDEGKTTQVIIHYTAGGEDRFESFLIFDDEDEDDFQDQLDDYLDMIYNDQGQSRRGAAVVDVTAEFVG